jgi:streptogramin lyase
MVWLKKLRSSSFGLAIMMLVLPISFHGVLLAAITTRRIVTYASNILLNDSLPTIVQEKPEQSNLSVTVSQSSKPVLREFPVPSGSRPHDVAPASNVTVWYTAQGSGELGRLNPSANETRHITLGRGSVPHGVIVGPDGAPWITDGGLNAIVRVDPETEEVKLFPLPEEAGYANLNTATSDHNGTGSPR